MKRRDLIKNAGILGLAGISASAILACKDTTPPVTPAPEAVVEPEKSEKEKLIINRQKMSFKDPENPTDFEWKHTPDIQLDFNFRKILVNFHPITFDVLLGGRPFQNKRKFNQHSAV